MTSAVIGLPASATSQSRPAVQLLSFMHYERSHNSMRTIGIGPDTSTTAGFPKVSVSHSQALSGRASSREVWFR